MAKRNRSRRGVLLLVVLSLLVMFVLAGMTFMLVAGVYRKSAAAYATVERTGDQPQNLADRGLDEILRGSLNNESSIGPHSLLEDAYGRDGFVATIVGFDPNYVVERGTASQFIEFQFRIARHMKPQAPVLRDPSGVMISRFGRPIVDAGSNPILFPPFPPDFEPVPILPDDDSRYNGCVLTLSSGHSSGQSTRIMRLARNNTIQLDLSKNPIPLAGYVIDPISTLNLGTIVVLQTGGGLRLSVGDQFVVNGRPFSGTGTGYSNISQDVDLGLNINGDFGSFKYNEVLPVSLLPNEYGMSTSIRGLQQNGVITPFTYVLDQAANTFDLDLEHNLLARAGWAPSSIGAADEGWDAADNQNMALAMVPPVAAYQDDPLKVG